MKRGPLMLVLSAGLAAGAEGIAPTLAGLPHPETALEFPAFVLDFEDLQLPGWRHAGSVWWWEAGCEAGGGARNAPYDRTSPVIHGLPGRMALVTLDGHPLVTDYMRGGSNLDVVPLSLLSSIEVAKLPYGGYWVPGAASGAVALNTLRPGAEERKLAAYAGGLGSFASSALLSGESYLLAGTLFSTDGTSEDEALSRRSALGKYLIMPGLTAQAFYTEADHETSFDALSLGGLKWEGTAWGGTTFVWGLSSSRFERTSDDFAGQVRDDLWRASVAVAPPPAGGHGVFLGADLTAEDLKHFGVDGESDTSFGVFARDEWSQTASFSVVGGLRYDHSGEDGDFLSPMLGTLWRKGDASLRVCGSLAYRPPSLQELYQGELDMGDYWLVGNEALGAEGVAGAELEWRFPVARWESGRAECRALGFYNWVENIIEPGYTGEDRGGEPLVRLVNSADAHTAGVEFETELKWGAWSAAASYTWTEAEYDETGARLQYYPGSSFKAALGYSRGGMRMELRSKFLSDRFASAPTGGAELLDRVSLVDLYLGYAKGDAEYFVGVENLGDDKYERAEDDITEASRGRAIVAGLRGRF